MSLKLFVYPINLSDLPLNTEEELVTPEEGTSGRGSEAFLQYDWCLLEGTGEYVASGRANPAAEILTNLARSDVQNVRLVALMPGEFTSTFEVMIPLKQQKYLNQALPFAVEEQLASDIEEAHIVCLQKKAMQESIPVLVVSRKLMAAYLEQLSQFSLPIYQMVPDSSLIPDVTEKKGEGISILLEEHVAHIKSEPLHWKLPKSALSRFIERILSDNETEEGVPVRCTVSEASSEQESIEIAAIEQITGSKATITTYRGELMILFGQVWSADPHAHPQLCQREFTQKSEKSSGLRQWRGVAAVLAVWFVIQLGLNIAQGIYFKKETGRLESQALSLYQSIFPGETKVSTANVERFFKSKLIQAGQQAGGHSFLDVLTNTGSEFKRANSKNDMSFKSINFNSQRGELSVELQVSRLEQLDALKSSLDRQGLSVKIGSAVQEKDFVRGRLTITSAG